MKILVTAKINPDLDGVACTLAYSDLLQKTGKDAEGIVFGGPLSEVQYFIEKYQLKIPRENSQVWDNFVLVDASSMKGMPEPVKASGVIEIIDHRKSEPEKEFPNAKIQNELIGAAATLVIERFINAKVVIQPEHARLLHGAIYHNTLNFTSFNTTDRVRNAADFLEKEFNLSSQIAREMFDFATRKIKSDVKLALKNDAKEFGTGHSIRAYQLIVWGSEILDQKDKIEAGVKELSQLSGANWSFVNVVDLENQHSHIFTPNPESQPFLEKALEAKFINNWTELPIVWLRKQIIPRLQDTMK